MDTAHQEAPEFWGVIFEDLYRSLMGHGSARRTLELINERRWTVKDSGATHRTINHWAAEGLIDDQRAVEGKGWRKFSLCEILWLRVVSEMREFGLPLDKIRRAYRSIFYNENGEYSLIEFSCATFLCVNKPVHAVFVVVLKDGTAKLTTYEAIKEQEKVNGLSAPYLRINLNEIIRSSMKDDAYAAPKPESTFLNNKEQEVLGSVRDADVQQVNIKMNNGSISDIEETKVLSGMLQLHDLLMSTNYGEVAFKIEGGRIRSTKHIIKRKT